MSAIGTQPAGLPPDWDDRDREDQIDWLRRVTSREGLLRQAVAYADGIDQRETVDNETRLNKDELAAIVLALEAEDG